jgi:glyoxylase-like metal-dependent hydrolase (beta-lactamase superfamily II)
MSADVTRIRADNPGPLTLRGTNTWVAGNDPCFVVDPGPALDDHLDAVEAEVARRGGADWIALTHGHADHSEAVEPLRGRIGSPPVARFGDVPAGVPFSVVPTPGHAPDHVAFVWENVGFTGDAVLGEGSVFVSSDLAGYLDSLRALQALSLDALLPGHGPPIDDPAAKFSEYLDHRLDRERRLVEALAGGARTIDEMLDAAWADVPDVLRPAAAITLGAHLGKLDEEGRLPEGVQRPGRA